MTQITPFPLWLGHAGDGRDVRAILGADIRAVVQLALEEPAIQLPRELMYCRFPLLDGAANPADLLRLAIHTLAVLLTHRTPTLVCCGAGRSRSPAIAAAALAHAHAQDPAMWLQRIREQWATDVSPGMWQDILLALKN